MESILSTVLIHEIVPLIDYVSLLQVSLVNKRFSRVLKPIIKSKLKSKLDLSEDEFNKVADKIYTDVPLTPLGSYPTYGRPLLDFPRIKFRLSPISLNTCIYHYRRGSNKNIFCGKPVVLESKFCKMCLRKIKHILQNFDPLIFVMHIDTLIEPDLKYAQKYIFVDNNIDVYKTRGSYYYDGDNVGRLWSYLGFAYLVQY